MDFVPGSFASLSNNKLEKVAGIILAENKEIDNKKLYEWFGVGPNKKWEALNKLANKNIIELKRGGRGRLPIVRIILPKKNLN